MKKLAVAAMSLFATVAFAQTDDPLLRPIAADYAARWLTPQKPVNIFGNFYLIGFGGLNVGLIRTDAGLILIDGALPQAVPAIEANIRALGFDIGDVKYILSTEPHYDHASGFAALQRDSGATVLAGPMAVPVLKRGASGSEDPQMGWLDKYPGVANVRAMPDGAKIRLGNTIVMARATAGHTPGSTSWSWESCERGVCKTIVFASSLNPVSAPDYSYSDPAHAPLLTAFRRTFAKLRKMPCDVLVSAHPDQSGGDIKLAQLIKAPTPNPFIDARSCVTYADKFEPLLDAKLAKEKARTK